MEGDEKIPMLLRFYFGEAAGRAQQGASRRLRGWARAFDEWMGERRRIYKPEATKQAGLAWRRLVRQCGKMPWELRREDIEKHAAWMEAEGFARSTIHCALGIVSSFYKWCDERGVDAACEAGFNPAREVVRPRVGRYGGAKLLSREEVEALLRALRKDQSELGRREQAFFLARLRSGVPLKRLQQLQWGQIEQDEAGKWVRWRENGGRMHLPEEVWEAVVAYLTASGRLEGMEEGKYVFAPLANPGQAETGSKTEDWVEGRCLSSSQILANLKLYGRLARIPEDKLTLMALRRTAVRLRMDEGGSLEEMQAFMDSQEGLRFTKYRLSKLPQLPGGEGQPEEEKTEGGPPVRRARPFKPGEGVTHGFYARSQPMEAVRAVLAEDIQGVEEEIAGLRTLIRGLLEREGDFVRLGEAYSQAVRRLGEMMAAEKQPEEGEEEAWADDFLKRLDTIEIEQGRPPISDEVRKEALRDEPELGVTSRRLVEEIATMRLLLRNAFRLAMEAQETQDYIRLVDLYSSGCVRLVRLLKVGGEDQGRLARYMQKQIDLALRDISKELGLEG